VKIKSKKQFKLIKMETRKKTIEYSFLRHNINPVSGQRSRLAIALFLGLLHLVFIVLYGFFVEYKLDDVENVSKRLSSKTIRIFF